MFLFFFRQWKQEQTSIKDDKKSWEEFNAYLNETFN